MTSGIARLVEWLRVGYPGGVPDRDYIPLMAVLRRRMSDEEITELGRELVREGIVPADRVDVGVGVIRTIDELPTPQEISRVVSRLRAAGWPVDHSVFDRYR